MAEIGDSGTYLNWKRYRYQVYDSGYGNVASMKHPGEEERDTRPSKNGQSKPSLLYSDQELLMAIANAESLQELEETLRENREHIDKVQEWTENQKEQESSEEEKPGIGRPVNNWELAYNDPVCESEDRIQRAIKAMISAKMTSVGDIPNGRLGRATKVNNFLDDVEKAHKQLEKILEMDKEQVQLRTDYELDENTNWDMEALEDMEEG